MRILIVVPKSKFFPVGIAYITASIKKAGLQVDCLNLNLEEDFLKIQWNKYDIIATGGLASQFKEIKIITDITKKAGKKVILGGGIVTAEPELMSNALNADYSVIGEGEQTVVELLQCIENSGELESVPGIGFFKNGKFVLTEKRNPILDLDSLHYPDYEALGFPLYLNRLRSSDVYNYNIYDYPRPYPVVTSRSCPFRCTFCYHPLGNKYRQRSIDSVMDELTVMVPRYRINMIEVYDELFSFNVERVYEFCTKFKQLASTLPWEIAWGCQFRVDRLNEHLLDIMKDAGCYIISYGFESASPIVLKSMKKHITPREIERAIQITLDRKISLQANFIFGDVAETMATAQETLAFWKKYCYAGILLGFIYPCPDSQLYRYCLEKGIIRDKLNYIQNHFFDIYNMTQLSEGEFYKLRVEVFKTSLKYSPCATPLKVGVDSITVTCPHCDAVNEYKNFDITHDNYDMYLLSPSRFFFNKMVYCRSCRLRFFIRSKAFKAYAAMIRIFLTPEILKLLAKIKQHAVQIPFLGRQR